MTKYNKSHRVKIDRKTIQSDVFRNFNSVTLQDRLDGGCGVKRVNVFGFVIKLSPSYLNSLPLIEIFNLNLNENNCENIFSCLHFV